MQRGDIRPVEPERVLETPRLLLEPLTEAHAAKIFGPLRDHRLYDFIPQDPPVSEGALRDRHRKLSSRLSPDRREAWLNWAMRTRDTEGYVGVLEATVRGDHTASIAYTVFAPYQRRGFAAEGCRRLLEHLFEDYGVGLISAEVDTRNAASVALLEGLGFARVAFREDADCFKGSSSDEYRYELRGPRVPR